MIIAISKIAMIIGITISIIRFVEFEFELIFEEVVDEMKFETVLDINVVFGDVEEIIPELNIVVVEENIVVEIDVGLYDSVAFDPPIA